MLQIDLPELEERSLDFTPDSVVRGDGDAAPVSFLEGRIRLGGPHCVPITPAYVRDDDGLRIFVEQEAGRFAYHLVHLSITFAAQPEKPRLERATVELTLTADGTAAPTAWSMKPESVVDPSTVTTTLTFAPRLKLSLAEAEVEAEIGSISRGREHTIDEPYLIAENSMRADPRWRFRRTRTMPLRGSQRLSLVVRGPWGVDATVKGRVTGSTLHHTFFRPEHADLPWPLTFRAEF